MMKEFTPEKGFYKSFFAVYVFLVLQNVVTLSVNLADNMMLGAYSETALSGVAAVNQIQFVYQQVLGALGEGIVIIGSQYWGKKQTEPIKRLAATAMYAGICLSMILFLAATLFPAQLLGLFTTDSEIIAEGVKYLGIIRFTYLFFAVTQILLATLRSTETVHIAFILSVQTFFVNCGINYVLIYGHFGAPEMGAGGAAVGTLAARVIELFVLILFIVFKENKLRLKLRDYLKLDGRILKDYARITSPMVVIQGLWGLNTALQTVILGHMTSAAIAANSVASTLFLMVKSAGTGASSTAQIIIGKAIGTGNEEQVKAYAKVLQRIFVVIGLAAGAFLFGIRIPVLRLYHLSDETMKLANQFLIVLSIVCVTMSYQMPTNNGIIRGGGSAMFVVKMDIISIWMIVIPLSLIMAFVVKASPLAVICCLNADQVFKCVPAYIKVNHGNWIKKLTR